MSEKFQWIARRGGWLAFLLVVIASSRIVSTYKVLSHTTDEPAHLAAGIEWLENRTYTYEDQHPPLARVVGAIGLHAAGSRWSRNSDMYSEGFHLLGENGRYAHNLFYSRLAMLPFFWIGAAVVYLWALRVAGELTALAATLLFTTMPPVLAHAGLVTTDMAVTAFTGAAVLASLYWAERPGWLRSVLLGFLTGLALLSKFSALAFLPAAWLLMSLIYVRREWKRIKALVPGAALSIFVAALTIWSGYRFDFKRVPAPEFFSGIGSVMQHNEWGHLAYLFGHLSQFGFWYYYPVVIAVKTPLAALILMACAIWYCRRLPISMPLAFTAAIFGVGLFSHINIGVRHILPVYMGFAICGGAALVRLLQSRRKWVVAAASALVLWQIVTGAVAHPDYIAYTNALAGSHPERILADSDLDWEQGMRGLAVRLQQLGVQKVTVKLKSTGFLIARGYRFPNFEYMPDGDQPPPGWSAVAITAWKLSGQPAWAAKFEPKERIRRSIFLYYFPRK